MVNVDRCVTVKAASRRLWEDEKRSGGLLQWAWLSFRHCFASLCCSRVAFDMASTLTPHSRGLIWRVKQERLFTNNLKIHRVSVAVLLQVFADYEKLLNSENYVTKRQSLKV